MDGIPPKISVVIPSFNSERTIERCVRSVLAQSFRNFEVLIVDDGSTDSSPALCDNLAREDSRIKVFHKANGGVSSARNIGLRQAEGEWVTFLDSDDELDPNHLVNAIDRESENCDLIILGYREVSDDESVLYETRPTKQKTADVPFLLKEMYNPTVCKYLGYCNSKFYKLAIIGNNQLWFDESIVFNEDRLFCVSYICKMNRPASVFLEPTYAYYIHPGSAMQSIKCEYNPAFITDLLAYVKMKRILVQTQYGKRFRRVANYGIFNSYVRILYMMSEFGIHDKFRHLKLLAITVISTGPISFMLMKRLRDSYII